MLEMFRYKRKDFEHEKEYRAFVGGGLTFQMILIHINNLYM